MVKLYDYFLVNLNPLIFWITKHDFIIDHFYLFPYFDSCSKDSSNHDLVFDDQIS